MNILRTVVEGPFKTQMLLTCSHDGGKLTGMGVHPIMGNRVMPKINSGWQGFEQVKYKLEEMVKNL
jgi:hypothetical protein